MGTVVARTGTGKRPKADKLAEAYTMFERLNAGEPAHRIYADMGMSKATFYRRIEWARQNVHDPAVEQYRTEAVARLATARQVLARTIAQTRPILAAREDVEVDDETGKVTTVKSMEPVRDPTTGDVLTEPVPDPSQMSALVSQWVRIEETEMKLRNAVAPTVVEHRVIVEDAFARLMSELNARPATQPQETRP